MPAGGDAETMRRAHHPGTARFMTTIIAPTPRFDTFYKHDELTQLLFEYSQAFPTLAAIRSIGKSFEGRDIWVATLTNQSARTNGIGRTW